MSGHDCPAHVTHYGDCSSIVGNPADYTANPRSRIAASTIAAKTSSARARRLLSFAPRSCRIHSGDRCNTLPLNFDPALAETVDSYEIGLKTDFFDRRVRLNLALFQNDIKNPQVQTIINTGALGVVGLTNAQKARSRGVEADANILVTQGLTARLAGTCLDAKYIEFTNAPFNFPPTDPVTGAIISPFGLLAPVLGDASGNRLARVPKFRFSAGINYDVKAEFGHVIFDASVAYTAKFAFDADNRIVQPHYALANASISYSPTVEDRWTVRAWMNNITNKKYYLNELPVANGSGNISAPAAPRTYGVEVGVKF